MKRLPILASFILFIALCVSLAFWGMQLFKPVSRAVTAPPQPPAAEVDLRVAGGLFGGRGATAVASNFQLKGVVAANDGHDSVAILSANGKPAQAVRQGAEILPGTVVKEVHRRYVLVSDGGVQKRVELPETASPSLALTNPAGTAAVPSRPAAPSVPNAPMPPSGASLGPAAPIQQPDATTAPANTGSGLVPMAPAH